MHYLLVTYRNAWEADAAS